MSDNDLDLIRQEEDRLREQMAQLQTKRRQLEEEARQREEEEKRKRELEKSIKVNVLSLSGGGLLVESLSRPDLVSFWQKVPGRAFKGYNYNELVNNEYLGKNWIPLKEWARVESELSALANVTVAWRKGLKDEVEWYTSAPPWEIVLHPNNREFICTPGPRCPNQYAFQSIPGAALDFDSNRTKISLPTTEGWRIWPLIEKLDGVVFSEAAKERIFEQIKARWELDQIAKLEDAPEVDVPFHTRLDLRKFQKVGVKFLSASTGRVLLADEMGLGKTIQALAFAILQRKSDPKYQTIIICPAALKPNWVREVKKLTGVEPVVCSGGKPEFFTIKKIMMERAPFVIINYDLVGKNIQVPILDDDGEPIKSQITGQAKTETIYPWVAIINNANPNLLLVDEAHYIKNQEASRTKGMLQLKDTPHIIELTGTPILNRTNEIWTLLRLLDPINFKSYDQFTKVYGDRVPRNVDQLHSMLKPMYLRRVKKDVLKDLPPINRIYDYHELSDPAKKMYRDVLQGLYEMLREFDPWGKGGGKVTIQHVLERILRLKQICAADKVEHVASQATEISDSHENGRAGKVVIFSQFKGTAYEIARHLGGDALCFVKRNISGDRANFETVGPQERDDLIQQFREDRYRYLVVTEKSAKEGHNIEFADAVMFNDLFWTPAAHAQAEGRVYGRLSGELRSINSYYLVTDPTDGFEIEDWIIELLFAKQEIVDAVTEGVEGARGDVSVQMELIQKMKEAMWGR